VPQSFPQQNSNPYWTTKGIGHTIFPLFFSLAAVWFLSGNSISSSRYQHAPGESLIHSSGSSSRCRHTSVFGPFWTLSLISHDANVKVGRPWSFMACGWGPTRRKTRNEEQVSVFSHGRLMPCLLAALIVGHYCHTSAYKFDLSRTWLRNLRLITYI